MSPRVMFNIVVGLIAIGAIFLVAGSSIDLPSFGGGDGDDDQAAEPVEVPQEEPRESPARTDTGSEAPGKPEDEKPVEQRPAEPKVVLPQNPDEVKGSQELSLHRPANLRRALRVLERERRRAEGVFDGLRVAPGRIDTTVNTPSKKINLQIRPDFKIAFRSESDFPNANNPRFRKSGLGAGAVDLTLPARMVRRIDKRRSGSAARDLDYFVIRRDIIDFKVNYGAYLRTGPPPRIFLLEPDEPFRAIG